MFRDAVCPTCGNTIPAKRGCIGCLGSGLAADATAEVLQWRLVHNHKRWSKALARKECGKKWTAGQPAEVWSGFRRLTWSARDGERVSALRLAGCDMLHNKRRLFLALNAAAGREQPGAPDGVARFLPETYCSRAEFVAAKSKRDDGCTAANLGGALVAGLIPVADGLKDVWFFKSRCAPRSGWRSSPRSHPAALSRAKVSDPVRPEPSSHR